MLVTLAASLLSSNEQIVAAPSLRIAALRGNGALGGPLLSAGSEKVVRNAMVDPHVAAEVDLEITVGGGDGWAEGVGQLGHPATTALLHSLKSLQGEEQGWNAVVSPLLGGANVSAPVNGTVRLRLPQLCSTCDTYSIEAPCVSWPRPLELLVYIHHTAWLLVPLADTTFETRRIAGRRSSWLSLPRHCCRARRLQPLARSSSTLPRARWCLVGRFRVGRWRRSL